ncbi:MAG: cupin domain-containing protein [Acidiferrobacterales bacterium]
MKPDIRKACSQSEHFTSERLFIQEIWNCADDELSIARARVKPGVTTSRHYLAGVHERYVVTVGRGRVEVGALPATEVGPGDVVVIPADTAQRITNIGEGDLMFYCICTPRFEPSCYREVEDD